jgi:hypothetical protein
MTNLKTRRPQGRGRRPTDTRAYGNGPQRRLRQDSKEMGLALSL